MTWYTRPPMTPAGTAHIAIDEKSSVVPTPRDSARRPAIRIATMTPSAIINPYAFRRKGPI